MTRIRAVLATLLASMALGACAEGSDEQPTDPPQTAANGDVFNEADVRFASDMVPHHAQALQMVDLTRGRDLSPQLTGLAEDIQMAQGPEIEQMVGWLTDWDRPVPETGRDHANAHGDGEMDLHEDMPGMMTAEQMAELESAQGGAFEERWLEMMIEHHRGAIEMARAEQAEGVFDPALDLAASIARSQEAEIERMEGLLDS